MTKVVRKRRPDRKWKLTVRWCAGDSPGSKSAVLRGKNIGDAIDLMDDDHFLSKDDFPDGILPKITSVNIDLREIPA